MNAFRSLGWIGLMAFASCVFAGQAGPSQADAEALLRKAKASSMFVDGDFAPYRAMGKKAVGLFAPYLLDKELGSLASFAMQEIDPVETTRYMLIALPRLDSQAQSDFLRAANRAMLEYDLFVRAGKPEQTATPRFPANRVPYPFKAQVRDAALEMLKQPNPSGPVFTAIGLAGDHRDISLLRPYVPASGSFHVSEVSAYALAAMARLGDKAALDRIESELSKPVSTVPEVGWSRENGGIIPPKPGAMVVPEPLGQHLRAEMYAAGFSMNRRFIPLLVRHLDDAPGQFHGDYGDPSPAQFAADALGQIVQGREYGGPVEKWKEWWAKGGSQ